MGRTLQIGMTGVVTIGIISALVLNGRNTASVFKTGGNATSNLFGTVISGKAATAK